MKNGSNDVWASTGNWRFAMTNSNAQAPTEEIRANRIGAVLSLMRISVYIAGRENTMVSATVLLYEIVAMC
jgi:hypothetical protein